MSNFCYKKKAIALFSFLFIGTIYLPMVSARIRPVEKVVVLDDLTSTDSLLVDSACIIQTEQSLFDKLELEQIGLSRVAYDYAMQGLSYMIENGKVNNSDIISIIDFSKPSTKKRLYVIDLKNGQLLFNTYVAHGVNSGKEYANRFSNIPESNQSSPGFYITLGTYIGGNGYSLKLDGIERGINDKANQRAIVMHGADYVSEALIRSQGFLGRSFGCPSVPQKLHKPIINKIKNGTCLFIYSPDKSYTNRSKILSTSRLTGKI